MKQTIEAFNERWTNYFRKNRLIWVTSCSDEWMTFAESFRILDVHLSNKQERTHGVDDAIIQLQNGLFYAKMNFQTLGLTYYLRTVEGEKRFHEALGFSRSEMMHFWKGMDFCHYSSFKRKVFKMLEEKEWQEFIAHYEHTLKGTYHRKGNEAWVVVDDVKIDLSTLYMRFRNRKDEENE